MVSISSVSKYVVSELSDGRRLIQRVDKYGNKSSELYNILGDLIRRVEIFPHENGKFIHTFSGKGKITHLQDGITRFEKAQSTNTNISDSIINGRKIRTIERTDACTGEVLSKIDIEI